jgi:hypothetical protein
VIIALGAVALAVFATGWAAYRRRPEQRLNRLRARCRTHLARAMRPRWEFVQIVREAVALFGPADVAKVAGVPITLIFAWQDFTFGNPPEEMYLRGPAVEAIADQLTGCGWVPERNARARLLREASALVAPITNPVARLTMPERKLLGPMLSPDEGLTPLDETQSRTGLTWDRDFAPKIKRRTK